MSRWTLVVGMAAAVGCSGITKEQYGAMEAEAAKYKQAWNDEKGKVSALEGNVKALEQQNATLKTQAGDLEKKVAETAAAKSELEVTAANLKEQSSEYANLNKELQGKLTLKLDERISFDANSAMLTPEAKHHLDAIEDAIVQLKDKSVIVAGYTDDVEAAGKDAVVKRWQLSTARALAVAKYLIGRGMDPMMIGIAGFGEGRPTAPNDSEGNRALNRRVEIALTPTGLKLGKVGVKPATLKKDQ